MLFALILSWLIYLFVVFEASLNLKNPTFVNLSNIVKTLLSLIELF